MRALGRAIAGLVLALSGTMAAIALPAATSHPGLTLAIGAAIALAGIAAIIRAALWRE